MTPPKGANGFPFLKGAAVTRQARMWNDVGPIDLRLPPELIDGEKFKPPGTPNNHHFKTRWWFHFKHIFFHPKPWENDPI